MIVKSFLAAGRKFTKGMGGILEGPQFVYVSDERRSLFCYDRGGKAVLLKGSKIDLR